MITSRPSQPKKRIHTLDIWRGFAIFGIFFANIHTMHSSFVNGDIFEGQFTGWAEDFARRFDQLFIYGKFFTIFSFLFGLGIAMQALRSIEKDTFSYSFFTRRMGALFIFGLLHITLFWSGDVLHVYAILGLLAVALLRIPTPYLAIGAFTVLLFPFYNTVFEWVLHMLNYKPASFMIGYEGDIMHNIFTEDPYWEHIQLRWRQYAANVPVLFLHLAPIAFAMFLLGLFFGKKGYVYRIEDVVKKITRHVLLIAIISNGYRLFFLFGLWDLDIWKDPNWRSVFIWIMQICDTLAGLFYLWLIAWSLKYNWMQKFLSPLKYVGRMALTNYLMQSVIGMILFTGVGFKLYETFSPFKLLLIVLGAFTLQVINSKLWLSHYKYGPIEWLWRCISYKKWLPIK